MSIDISHPAEPNGALTLWRAWRAKRAQERERVRTIKIISDLPRDLRADIGWPARYYSEHERD
jgi:hypothetical protein